MLFLDSSYLIALILENDNYNDKAIELNKIISNETTIINNTVLTEVLIALLHTMLHRLKVL